MLKKLLLFGLPVAAIAILFTQIASADYYDCQGNIRPGYPNASQCRGLKTPPAPINDVQTQPNSSFSLTPTCNGVPCDIPQYRPERTTNPQTSINEAEELNPNNQDVPQSVNEPDKSEGFIKNIRKYCIRNYCYIIYEYCINGYCKETSKRILQDELDNNYSIQNNWNDRLNNYFYNNYYEGCRDDYRGKCIYRGTHYGRYHDNYWDF